MERFKQPHEDVIGIDRSDSYLLSIDEQALVHRDIIINVANHLYSACGVGNPAPIVERMSKRILEPLPGDLVVVQFANLNNPDTRLKGFGYFIEKRVEWWTSDEEWETEKAENDIDDNERMTDTAWYVQYGPNAADVCRWTNCQFIMVPTEPRMFDLVFGKRDGNSVTITRNDLLGALADSGIRLRTNIYDSE